jgi:hypothetical protein
VADKKNFILRLDADVYKLLEKWAADEFRSVNGQLEWIIHQQLRAAGRMAGKEGGMEDGKKGRGRKGGEEERRKGMEDGAKE